MADQTGMITGTFLDEITCDIGSQNWSADDWKQCFEAMKFIGIDTVIIIRGGLRNQAVFPSEVVKNLDDPDQAQVFLDEAARHNMRLFFGTYDSGMAHTGRFVGMSADEEPLKTEIAQSTAFIDEVLSRYGGHPAFKGWYLTYEVGADHKAFSTLFVEISAYLKQMSPDLPILISPYFATRYWLKDKYMPPAETKEAWRELLSRTKGLIDIMAFQDGHCNIDEYADYLVAAREAADEFGVDYWSNIETFDRHMSYHFPPRDIRVLERRLKIAAPHVTKQITFEFSHFMSPNSSFPGAPNLYRRYCESVLGKKSPF